MTNVEKMTVAVSKALEPGESIKARAAGRTTIKRGVDNSIVDGLVCATEYHVYITTCSFWPFRPSEPYHFVFERVGIPTFDKDKSKLYLPIPSAQMFELENVLENPNPEELTEFIKSKKSSTGKVAPPGQTQTVNVYNNSSRD
jgi:hypothetical protein